jgi:hypothetical protein
MGNVLQKAIPFNQEITALSGAATSLLFAGKCLTYCSAAGTVANIGMGIYKTISGVQAQSYLLKLGGEISEDVKSLSDSVGIVANHMDQAQFAQHVYDFAEMHIALAEGSGRRTFFFIFHPGTDWHPAFMQLMKRNGVLPICGIQNDIGCLAAFLIGFRRMVGPDAVLQYV